MATKKRGFKAGTPKAKLAGARSARSRAYNTLQREYDAEPSVGKKASIKRKMNALPKL